MFCFSLARSSQMSRSLRTAERRAPKTRFRPGYQAQDIRYVLCARVSPVPPVSHQSRPRQLTVVNAGFRCRPQLSRPQTKENFKGHSPAPPTAWAVGEQHQLRVWQRQWRRRSQAGRRTRGCQWHPVRARACHLVLPRRGARVLGRRARRRTTSRKRCVSPSNLARVLGTFRGGRLHACTH